MLVWIKVPCVAVGVLATFVLLLSPAVSDELPPTPSPDSLSTTSLAGAEEEETIQLMQLPFADSLMNPCASESTGNRPSYVAAEGHRASFAAEFFRFISHYAKNYKEDALQVLRNHTITGCETLEVTDLPDTPTLEELQEMDAEEALNRIYSSLLLHSAYAYMIHYQFTTSSIQCSEDIDGEESLATQSLQLAFKHKSLACYMRVGMAVLGYKQHQLSSWVNETLSHLTLCSRRALRDCQVINSIANFLKVLEGYSESLS